jgi:hypothetical protein
MAREKFPSDDAERLMLRFPPGMRERIAEEAKANNRSMNSEIISRLKSSLEVRTAYDFGALDAWLGQDHHDPSVLLYELKRQAQSNLASTEKLLTALERLGQKIYDPEEADQRALRDTITRAESAKDVTPRERTKPKPD